MSRWLLSKTFGGKEENFNYRQEKTNWIKVKKDVADACELYFIVFDLIIINIICLVYLSLQCYLVLYFHKNYLDFS